MGHRSRSIYSVPASCFNNIDDTSYPIFEKLGLGEEGQSWGDAIQASQFVTIIDELKKHYSRIASRALKSDVHDDFEATLYFLRHCHEWTIEHHQDIRLVMA